MSARPRHRRRRDDRGIAIVIVALLLLVLMAFVGFAVDIGFVYDQRREQQNAIDSAVLAAAKDGNKASEKVWVDRIFYMVNLNSDPDYTAADWQNTANCDSADIPASYTAIGSVSAVGAAAATPAPPASGITTTNCVAVYGTGYNWRIWAKAPDRNVEAQFAKFVGFNTFETTAMAIAAKSPERPLTNVLPFSITSINGQSGEYCAKEPPTGHGNITCTGNTTGQYGDLAMVRPIADDVGDNDCNGGHKDTIAANIAVGLDHQLSLHDDPSYVDNDGVDSDDIHETCLNVLGGLRPNHMNMETGNTADTYLGPGLFGANGTFSDGLGGRLTRYPAGNAFYTGSTPGVPYTGTFDNRPLWSYISASANFSGAAGGLPTQCNPNPGELAGETLPASLGGGDADIQLYHGSTGTVSLQGQDGVLQNHVEMGNCLKVYERGTDDDPSNGTDFGTLFSKDTNGDGTYDIQESPRFVWIPEADVDLNDSDGDSSNNCGNGNNCDWDIKRFRPAFIAGIYFDKTDWYPGEPVAFWAAGSSTKIEAFSVWVFDWDETSFNANMLPQEVVDAGPMNLNIIPPVWLVR